MAIGVTFSVKSNLGVSPVNAIPYVVSLISGLDQGLCVSVIFCSYIILQVFILKKDFTNYMRKPIWLLCFFFKYDILLYTF